MAGTITEMEIQRRNRDRVNIYLDESFAFGLSVILAAGLHKGQSLSDSEIAALRSQDEGEQAYERAVRFLATRPRSIGEIRRYLANKPGKQGKPNRQDTRLANALIDEVIERLEHRGYVNDLAFARYWIEQRDQSDPRGVRMLRYELREKDVTSDVIEAALDQHDEEDAAYRAALKKARRWTALDDKAFRDKLGGYLVRRGFDYSTVSDVLGRLISERREAGGSFTLSEEDNTHDNQE